MENMETFASLINSLKNSYENGAEKSQLLQILDKMRNELASATMVPDHTSAPVSVWLPSGYQPQNSATTITAKDSKEPDWLVESEEAPVFSGLTIKAENFIPGIVEDSQNIQGVPENQKLAEAFSLGTVPKPPIRIMVEQEDFSNEAIEAAIPEIGQIEVGWTESTLDDSNPEVINEIKEESELPHVFELTLDVPEVLANEELGHEKPLSIPPGFLIGEQPKATLAPKPRELHEILANRVVAKEETLRHQPKMLADTLGASKIHDLKKGIGINDRFRFINSLFRGDETLFERSIKTINNYNILPEAEYWIQRELVIKLGWNEEDELVQLFYHLVNRRFL
jgi:hypothetical protein